MIHKTKSVDSFLTVIIPTWNSGAYLSRCLDCLAKQTYTEFEVVIVDNGSDDFQPGKNPADWLSLNIREHSNKENRGFAVACNQGAEIAKGRWLAFLNADVFPAPDWMEQFIISLKHNSQAAVFCSFITQANDPDLIDGTGDIYNISGTAWKRGYGYPIDHAPSQPERVFSANAAAAFYRRDIFLEIGGFDEDFFSFIEDVDLGFRLNLYGYKCFFPPSVKAEHVGSSSAGRGSDFAIYHRHRNTEWAYIKNMPFLLFWLYLPVHFLGVVIYLFYYLRHKRARVFLRAKWDALKGLGKMLAKRKIVQGDRRASVREINQLMDKNLLAPFLLGRNMRRYNRSKSNRNK